VASPAATGKSERMGNLGKLTSEEEILGVARGL
jgi:hypothetical protein